MSHFWSRDTDEQERRFGLHSGIPECCVEAFVAGRHAFALDSRLGHVGYVPCVSCEQKMLHGLMTPAVIHTCTPGQSQTCDEFLEVRGRKRVGR